MNAFARASYLLYMSSQFALRESADGAFVPYFQPIVDLRLGSLAGFELLARQIHPLKGLTLPDHFIPAAEKEGWINDLTFHLLERALPSCAKLPCDPFLAINISAIQLHDLELPEKIRDMAKSAGFPCDRLTIEVTETSLLPNLDKARTVAERFRSLGCGLALDDFGTGYSSLKTLQALPFNVLKVDRSFVSTMTETKESRKIVAAVIGLGQSLSIKTVAEGIETPEQNEMIDWLGANFGQGWYHGRPVPCGALAETCLKPRFKSVPHKSVEDLDNRRSLSRFDDPPYVRLAQLRSVYEAVPVGLAFVDRNLRYVNINRRLADINCAKMVDHLGRTMQEMIPEIYPQVGPDLERALHGESVLGSIVKGQPHPSSTEGMFLVSYEPARDEGGEVVGVSIAVLEISSVNVLLPPAALEAITKANII